METPNSKTLILASQSPRRAEILKRAAYNFLPFPAYVSEIPRENLSLDDKIIDIAYRKAMEAFRLFPDKGLDAVIVAADTVVCLGDQIYGKPLSPAEAASILKSLSGKVHQVKTALYLLDLKTQEQLSHIETTNVEFFALSDEDIARYIDTQEPMDKAGAYGIQGQGRRFVKNFSGDYNNVVGLPLQALEKIFMIKKWQFKKGL
jgi:septum formation protein